MIALIIGGVVYVLFICGVIDKSESYILICALYIYWLIICHKITAAKKAKEEAEIRARLLKILK
jgi:hypothetical protein